MIDYAIQPNSDMIKFNNYCKMKSAEFIWIDHHITAIENIGVDIIPGLQDSEFSGCFNTWAYIMEQVKQIRKAPKILLMINDFDTWKRNTSKFSWEDEILPITYYLDSLGVDLNNNENKLVSFLKDAFKDDQLTDVLNDSITIGKNIYNYVKSLYNQNSKKIYNIEWNGYNCLVLNSTIPGSMQFENHPDYKNVDLCLTWSYDGKYYFYGAYTTKSNIDVGNLCETFFNGGRS